MNKLVLAGLAFLFVFSATMPSSAAGAPRKPVTIEEFTEVLRTKDTDRITDSLADIMTMFGHEQKIILDFLMDLWSGRREKYPSLPWKVIGSDGVKLEIANVLLQARRNGAIAFDPKAFETFAYAKFESRDKLFVARAANVLGQAETDRAAAILHKEAQRKDRTMFRLAVWVLTRMCNASAEKAVEALLKEPLAPAERNDLLETRRKREQMKKQTQMCNRNSVIPPSSVVGPPRESVTIGEFTEVLRTRDADRITGSLDTIRKMFGHEQEIMLEFLMDLWTGRKDKHPSLPWKVIKRDRVKLEIADALLQARNNKNIDFDPADMVTFAYAKLESLNLIVVVRAANVLGFTETDRAVAILHKEAIRKERDMFRLAVGALTSMCNPKAGVAVEALLNDPLPITKREFLLKMKREREEMDRESRFCDQNFKPREAPGIQPSAKGKNRYDEKTIRGKIDANLVHLISKYIILHEGVAYELWFPRTARMGRPTKKKTGVIALPIPGSKDAYPVDLSAVYEISGQVISKETDFTERKSNESVQVCFQGEMKSGSDDRCELAVKFRGKGLRFKGKYPIALFKVRSFKLFKIN